MMRINKEKLKELVNKELVTVEVEGRRVIYTPTTPMYGLRDNLVAITKPVKIIDNNKGEFKIVLNESIKGCDIVSDHFIQSICTHLAILRSMLEKDN